MRPPGTSDPPVQPDRSSAEGELAGALISGRYRIECLAARGGMSRVYRAVQEALGRTVAVKVLDSPPGMDPAELTEVRTRFLREAATTARLRHPNTVVIHDYGVVEETGELYMVLEWVEGQTLLQELRRKGPLDPQRATRIGIEIARVLQKAHELGIVHRDLKPSNVMLVDGPDGDLVKVLDFGIAKADLGGITRDGDVLGTPRYMAPEQIRGVVDPRTDLYSLGVLLYEILAGRTPFEGPTSLSALIERTEQDAPSLSVASSQPIPEALAQIVTWCIQRRPEDRPATAAVVRHALQTANSEMGGVDTISVGRSIEGSGRRSVPARPNRWMALVLVLLSAVAVAAIGLAVLCWVTISVVVASRTDPGSVAADPPEDQVVAGEPTSETHIVTLISTPAGATVERDGERLGVTPLFVDVPQGVSAAWQLSLEGHVGRTLTVDRLADDAELRADLAPVPRPAPPRGSPGEPTKKPGDIRHRR